MLDSNLRLSANFTVGEFQRASNRTLVLADLPAMELLVNQILQPVRRQFGEVRITSFVRSGDTGRAHERGGAVDFVPVEASMDMVFDWLCRFHAGAFGRLIHERDHLHVTRPGPEPWAGHGVCLIEPVEGEYQFAGITPLVVTGGGLAVAGTPIVRDVEPVIDQMGPLVAGVGNDAVSIVLVVAIAGALIWRVRNG
jgi:hypothetical protein